MAADGWLRCPGDAGATSQEVLKGQTSGMSTDGLLWTRAGSSTHVWAAPLSASGLRPYDVSAVFQASGDLVLSLPATRGRMSVH